MSFTCDRQWIFSLLTEMPFTAPRVMWSWTYCFYCGVCACVYEFVCARTSMWRLEVSVQCLPSKFRYYFSLNLELTGWLDWPVMSRLLSPLFYCWDHSYIPPYSEVLRYTLIFFKFYCFWCQRDAKDGQRGHWGIDKSSNSSWTSRRSIHLDGEWWLGFL